MRMASAGVGKVRLRKGEAVDKYGRDRLDRNRCDGKDKAREESSGVGAACGRGDLLWVWWLVCPRCCSSAVPPIEPHERERVRRGREQSDPRHDDGTLRFGGGLPASKALGRCRCVFGGRLHPKRSPTSARRVGGGGLLRPPLDTAGGGQLATESLTRPPVRRRRRIRPAVRRRAGWRASVRSAHPPPVCVSMRIR